MKLKDKYPLIKVRWADHWIHREDLTLDEIKENLDAMYGSYAGHLVAESKQVVVICSNVWEGDEGEAIFSDPMYIMKRAIVYRSDKDDNADSN